MDSSGLLGTAMELQSQGALSQVGDDGEPSVQGLDDCASRGSWGDGALAQILGRHALPDCGFECAPLEAVRFAKFLGVVGLLIGLTRTVVVGLDLEYDHTYGVDAFLRYDVNEVLLDLLFMFIAGRLYAQPAIDELGFAAIAACNAFMMSVLNEIPALQHSFSLYEIHCRWTLGTYAFVALFASIFMQMLRLHYRYLKSSQPVVLKRALLQLVVMFVLFWCPHLADSDFHIHHWFYSWFVACQCNFTPWWSRATQAWFLGGYINGIAVYGRDPILVCEAAFYRASSANCKFMEHLGSCTNETIRVSEPPADWWTCTGDYH